MKRLIYPMIAASSILANVDSAEALSQKKHAEISEQACLAAGFGSSFCRRVGDEAYNTDADEFEDLAAHAQPDDGMSSCAAASRSMARLRDLGREIRTNLRAVQGRPSDRALGAAVARALGRALHTIEDNCAHHGMPNPQHAWFSLNDACHFTSTSPDSAPAAATCARQEAAAVMAAVRRASDALGLDRSTLVADTVRRRFPPVLAACEFLGDATRWDGRDRRWDNAITVPAFRRQMVDATTIEGAGGATICSPGQTLARPSRVDVDTSGGVGTLCEAVVDFCDGDKNDGSVEPPWEHDDGPELQGGCAAGAANGLVLALGLAGLLGASRRRKAARIDDMYDSRATSRRPRN